MTLLVLGAHLLLWPKLFWADFRVLRVDFIERGNHTIMVRVCNPTLRWVYYNDSFFDRIAPYGTSLLYKRRLDIKYVYLRDTFAEPSGFTFGMMAGSLAPFSCKIREAKADYILRREEELKIHDPDDIIDKYRLEFRITGGVPIIDPDHGLIPHDDGTEKKFYCPWYDYKPDEDKN